MYSGLSLFLILAEMYNMPTIGSYLEWTGMHGMSCRGNSRFIKQDMQELSPRICILTLYNTMYLPKINLFDRIKVY